MNSLTSNRRIMVSFVVSLFLLSAVLVAAPVHATSCLTVTNGTRFLGMTAAYINSGWGSDVDALGCKIGIYVNVPGTRVSGVSVHDATQFGIAVDETSSVIVEDSTVHSIGVHDSNGNYAPNGAQQGVGIYFYASSGAITDNNVHDCQKNGITANMPNSNGETVRIAGNTVTGAGHVDWIAQNGIQIGYGASGTIMSNVVSHHWYNGLDWASAGILVFEASDVTVHGNVLDDNQVGVAIEAWGWYVSSASENRVMKNTITEGQIGVSVAAYAWEYTTTGEAIADNNKATNNVIRNNEDYGVYIGTWVEDTEYGTASADNNKVINNTFGGNGSNIFDGGSATKVHANVFT